VHVGGRACAGNTVTATLPWTGWTWRADASALPSAAAVFVVNGFATASLPLAAVQHSENRAVSPFPLRSLRPQISVRALLGGETHAD
jgi:hypothetical protein